VSQFPAETVTARNIRGQRLPGQRQTDVMNLANIKELEVMSALVIVWLFYGTRAAWKQEAIFGSKCV